MIFLWTIPASLILVVLAACFLRLAMMKKKIQTADKFSQNENTIVPEASLNRFSNALKIPTISWPEDKEDSEKTLTEFQDYLLQNYPCFHARAERTILDAWNVIYKIKGNNPGLKPVLFIAHYDVVPPGTKEWNIPPFSGLIKDGYIHGRGTLDTKNTLIGLMEAGEELCSRNHNFQRDIYFSFGGDEEKNGIKGAMKAVSWFKKNSIRFDWILDEGGIVGSQILKGLKEPMGLVGVAEKGFSNLVLSVSQKSGHSSRPPKNQAAALLGKALMKKEQKQFPMVLLPAVRKFFEGIAPYMTFPSNLILANLWLFKPLFLKIMSSDPAAAAMLRTTTAFTRLEGSQAVNVLPETVHAYCNLRLLPGWPVQKAFQWFKKSVKMKGLQIELDQSTWHNDPVEEASVETPAYKLLQKTIREVFHVQLVLPYLNTAQTDSRHFSDLADNIYRFAPMQLNSVELDLIHGTDEKISVSNFGKGIDFFISVIGQL